MRFCTPTWLAARPTPGASYMVVIMSLARRASAPSISVTSGQRVRSTGSPTRRISWGAMAGQATGELLDLGCGYGPIGVALARRAPDARVWAVDVNRRALGLCAANAAAAGVEVR